jgi:two-component system cell cycle sensor histidine kinase/response regulator CckA
VAQQITSRPGLFIAGYTALALALGALVIALRGYDFLLFILIWPVILSAMLVPWRMYLILIGIGVTVTAITLPLVVPDLNRSATTAAAATASAFLICESVYRVMRRQRAMARAVQESEARFRCTFERAPAPMAITDVHGRLKWFNQRLCDVLGYERDALKGRMINDFAHPEDRYIRLHSALIAAVDGEVSVEKRYIASDGREIPMLVKGTLIRDAAGEPHETLVIFFDLTAQREAEAQRLAVERAMQETQRLESMGTLAGGLAHDFNNLLSGILGNTNLALLNIPAHAPARAYLEQVEIAAQRAAEITRQILAYTGRGQVAREVIDVRHLLNDLKTLLDTAAPATITINYQLEPGPLPVCFDRTQLRQVIVALIHNAVDAINDDVGQITVTIGERLFDADHLPRDTVGADLRAGRYAVIEVRDTGCGIGEDARDLLFVPFFTTKKERRGLGLAATLGIVRSHGGAIQVESAPGQGSIFRVFIPIALESPEMKTEPAVVDGSPPVVQSLDNQASPVQSVSAGLAPAPPVDQRSAAHAMQDLVLIVDDEPTVRSVAARMVEHVGFTTLQASDGVAGVDLFRANADSIACVLLDVSMPGIGGAQALQMMRAIRPDTPIVLMSGYAGEDLADRFAQLRPNGFLYKPFGIAELKACLQGAIREGVRAG